MIQVKERLGQQIVVIPPSMGLGPPRMTMTLRYSANGICNNAGLVYGSRRYIPTYVYDVDPSLGNTAVPGLAEWGGIYRLYRVNLSRCRATFSNKEVFPVIVYICPVNTDPGLNTANYSYYLSNPLSKQHSVGPLTGNGITALEDFQSTSRFAGVANSSQIDTYVGSSNGGTAPTNNWYWQVGVVTDGTVLSAGVLINVNIEMEVEFFELLTPST